MGFKWQESFVQAFKDYCENTTLHGFQYLVEPKRHKLEKFVWFCVLVTAIAVAVQLFLLMSQEFVKTPTVTTLDSTSYPIHKVPFPGVAICDNNRISKRHARSYASRNYKLLNISEDTLFEKLKFLGPLYDFSIQNIGEVNIFYRLLEMKNHKLSKDADTIEGVLESLAPRCNEILKKCSWNGINIPCLDLFSSRRTMNGICCVMNSFRTNTGTAYQPKFKKQTKPNTTVLTTPGWEMGLSVVVKTDTEDDYYPLLPMEGLKTFIFRQHDFPDIYSGGLFENIIPPGTEAFLKIEAFTVYAVDALVEYHHTKRECVLDSDQDITLGYLVDSTHYSFSNCITECKMNSIMALCDCIPFFMNINKKYKFSQRVCTLADIVCLNKYKDKWMTMYPHTQDEDLAFEKDNSMLCDCYPACNYVEYQVSNDYATLIDTGSGFLHGLNPRKHSLIHIYFDSDRTELYKTDLYSYWFDQLSNFGGLCGLFLGFSVISVIEFVYFFTVHYIKILLKTRTVSEKKPESAVSNTSVSTVEKLNATNKEMSVVDW